MTGLNVYESTNETYKTHPKLLNLFLHDPDVTNLHTHGLHTSPDGFFEFLFFLYVCARVRQANFVFCENFIFCTRMFDLKKNGNKK